MPEGSKELKLVERLYSALLAANTKDEGKSGFITTDEIRKAENDINLAIAHDPDARREITNYMSSHDVDKLPIAVLAKVLAKTADQTDGKEDGYALVGKDAKAFAPQDLRANLNAIEIKRR